MAKSELKASNFIPFYNSKYKTNIEVNENENVIRKAYIDKTSPQSIDEENHTVICKISDSTIDRQGDIIICSGADLTDYIKNPVVMNEHNYSSPPVATCEKLWMDGDALMAMVKFHIEDEDSNKMWIKVKTGLIKAVSIGFLAKNVAKKGTREFKEYISRIDANIRDNVERIITSFKMLEFSFVSLPCNPNALIKNIEGDNNQEVIETQEEDIKEEVIEDIKEISHNPDIENCGCKECLSKKDIKEDEKPDEKPIEPQKPQENQEISQNTEESKETVDNGDKDSEVHNEDNTNSQEDNKETDEKKHIDNIDIIIKAEESKENTQEEISELVKLIRIAITQEQEAIIQYDTIIKESNNDNIKKIIISIRDEEITHTGELQECLNILSNKEEILREDGEKEVEEIVNNNEEKPQEKSINKDDIVTLEYLNYIKDQIETIKNSKEVVILDQKGIELGNIDGNTIISTHFEPLMIKYSMDLVVAGNHMKWDFIPDNIILVDKDYSMENDKHNLYHELIEVKLMKSGLKYDEAHNIANEFEKGYIKELLNKSIQASSQAPSIKLIKKGINRQEIIEKELEKELNKAKEEKAYKEMVKEYRNKGKIIIEN